MSFPVTALTKTAAVRRATRTDAKRLVAAVLTAAGRSKRAGFKPHNKLLHTKAQQHKHSLGQRLFQVLTVAAYREGT
jgi:CTP:molybdopterin cytidylyltransferase MocA